MARCQERVMERDNEGTITVSFQNASVLTAPSGLLVELIKLKEVLDQLPYVFHKISVNPHAGENFGKCLRQPRHPISD